MNKYLYVIAYAPITNTTMVSFQSVQITAESEDDAYYFGLSNNSIVIPAGYTRLNDYVVKIN